MAVDKKAIQTFVLMLVCILVTGAGLLIKADKVAAKVEPHEVHTPEFQKAFFDASRVYGRANCGDQALAESTARKSIETGVSGRGAIGLMQVMPRVWNKQYDFSKTNLLNPDDNINVGVNIIGKLIKDTSTKAGLIRYYGTGVDNQGPTGVQYADNVLRLAGKF
jgi:hypothetical protein